MRLRPDRGVSMVYGGPSMPQAKKETLKKLEAMSHEKTKEFLEAPLPPEHDTEPPPALDEYEKRRLRVTSRVDETGLLCVKIYVDGKLVSESSANGTTVNIETDV